MKDTPEKLEKIFQFYNEIELEKELGILKKALLIYYISNAINIKKIFRTDKGFCKFFRLKKYTPRAFFLYIEENLKRAYLFSPGDTKSRINFMKNYIKYLKKYINGIYSN